MTKEEIVQYEYCKDYLGSLNAYREKLPFKRQKYGCGTGTPNIESTLEDIHRGMYNKIIYAMKDAEEQTQKIIDNI